MEDKSLSLTNFFAEYYKPFAQNKNFSSIASLVDGLKPTARKAVHTVQDNNITTWMKVEGLANLTAGKTEYLGGAGNISGVIAGITKTYTGSNNYPMFEGKGNFGRRLIPRPGEPRYILARKNAKDGMFIDTDKNILIEQIFEGTVIEPRFYVPTLPLILINSNEGLGSGHSQNIYCRLMKDIKKATISFIKTGKVAIPVPNWNGFTGTVKRGERQNQYIVTGCFSLTKNIVKVSEIPVGLSLLQYTKKLDKLVEKRVIQSYSDKSCTKKDIFNIEVKLPKGFDVSDENIIKVLGLSASITENLTCIDENNAVKRFESPEDVFLQYADVKLKFIQKRKDFLIDQLQRKINVNAAKYVFISAVVNDKIIISKKTKEQINLQIEKNENVDKIVKIDGSWDYLLRMPMHSLTNEKIKSLKEEIQIGKAELKEMKIKDTKDIWLEEVQAVKVS